jgi:hypothetical protein
MAVATRGEITNYSLVKIKKLNDFKDRPQAYDATRMIVNSSVGKTPFASRRPTIPRAAGYPGSRRGGG